MVGLIDGLALGLAPVLLGAASVVWTAIQIALQLTDLPSHKECWGWS